MIYFYSINIKQSIYALTKILVSKDINDWKI